ncbi:MAG: hypothetical protein HQL18_01595, partial [Candidatus Omnitrophica bacterium]|nr:hypothetical protein [Candidatus Omnitrophota bacterium]
LVSVELGLPGGEKVEIPRLEGARNDTEPGARNDTKFGARNDTNVIPSEDAARVEGSQPDALSSDASQQADHADEIRNSPNATTMQRWGKTFVDWWHYVFALRLLTTKPVEQLRDLLKDPSPEAISALGKGKYGDPNIDKYVESQSDDTRGQPVVEAVTNAIDAVKILRKVGGLAGQFGLGVKPFWNWLRSPKDRLTITTNNGEGKVYVQTLARGTQGGSFITPPQETDIDFPQGTEVFLELGEDIPLGDPNGSSRKLTQWGLAQRILKRFRYERNVDVLVRINGEEHWVNGWGQRKTLMGTPRDDRAKQPDVVVEITGRTVRIRDIGAGMKYEHLAKMFVPEDSETKRVDPLTKEEDIQDELKRVAVFEEEAGAGTVAFVRNGEVLQRVDLFKERSEEKEQAILPEAVATGEMGLEFGRFIGTQMSRDQVGFPPKKEIFVRAAMRMIEGLKANDALSPELKLRYINTIVTAIRKIDPGNVTIEGIAGDIQQKARAFIKDLVISLREKGVVFLPHFRPYGQLDLKGAQVVYLDPGLFDWNGQTSLLKLKDQGFFGIDRRAIHYVTTEKDGTRSEVHILGVPVKDTVGRELASGPAPFAIRKFPWFAPPVEPIIFGGDFIAMPDQWLKRFKVLSDKKMAGTLTLLERLEFMVKAQVIKAALEKTTKTGYEIVEPKPSVVLPPEAGKVEELHDTGRPDEPQYNTVLDKKNFPELKRPRPAGALVAPKRAFPQGEPSGRFIVSNGELWDIETGAKVEVPDTTGRTLIRYQPLGKKHYLMFYDPGFPYLMERTPAGKLKLVNVVESFVEAADGKFVMESKNQALVVVDSKADMRHLLPVVVKKYTLSADRTAVLVELNDEESPLCWFDLSKAGRPERQWLVKGKISARNAELPPSLAPVAVINKDGKDTAWDLRRNWSLPNYVATDPTGQFSIMASGTEVTLFSHRNGKPIRSILGLLIDKVTYGATADQPDKIRIMAEVEGGARYWIEDGTPQSVPAGQELQWFISVDNKGQCNFKKNDEWLARVQRASVENFMPVSYYKHPDLDVVISMPGAGKPTAYDLKSDKKTKFEGAIRGVHSDGGIFIVYIKQDDKMMFWSNDDFHATYPLDKTGRFQVEWVGDGGWGVFQGKLPLMILGLKRADYPEVFYDGEYFVFTNPATHQAAFVHPSDPANPIIGWPKEEAPPEPVAPKGEPKGRLLFLKDKIWDIKTDSEVKLIGLHPPGEVSGYQALGNDFYLVHVSLGDKGEQDHWIAQRIPTGEISFADRVKEFVELPGGTFMYLDGDKCLRFLDPKTAKPEALAENVEKIILSADRKTALVTQTGKDTSLRFDLSKPGKPSSSKFDEMPSDKNSDLPPVPAPIMAIHDGMDDFVWDLQRQEHILNYVFTDPTGQFSVQADGMSKKHSGSTAEGGMTLHSHRSADRLSNINGELITWVTYGSIDDPSKVRIVAATASGKRYWILHDETGRITWIPVADSAQPLQWNWSMSVDEYTNYGLVVNETSVESGLSFRPGFFHPVPIYKHPEFDVLIDRSDPNNLQAIDLKTGAKTIFQGKIVGVGSNPGAGSWGVYAEQGNKTMFWTDNKVYPSTPLDKTGRFKVNSKFTGDSMTGSWTIGIGDDARDHVSTGLQTSDYPEFFYDGEYFVFYNPDTGKAAFVHPDDPTHPIIGWPKEETPPEAPVAALAPEAGTDFPDGEPEGRFMVHEGNIYDLQTKKPVNLTMMLGSPLSIEAVGRGHYLIHSQLVSGGIEAVIVPYKDGKLVYEQRVQVNNLQRANDGRLVFVGADNKAYLFDPKDEGKPFALSSEVDALNMVLSADRNYALVQVSDRAVAFDLKRPEGFVAGARRVVSAFLDINGFQGIAEESKTLPRSSAPITILKKNNSPVVVDLLTGRELRGYVASDPTGKFAILDRGNGRQVFYHYRSAEESAAFREVWIGPDKDGKYRYIVQDQGELMEMVFDEATRHFSYQSVSVLPDDLVWSQYVVGGAIRFRQPNGDPINGTVSSTGFYKHPDRDIVISNGNTATDLKSRKSTKFEGEIIDAFVRKDFLYVTTMNNGKLECWKDDKKLISAAGAVDNKSPVRFLVDTALGTNYVLRDLKDNTVLVGLGVKASEYPQVSFDGKYFVFTNPATKDAVYVNPEKPSEIRRWAKPELSAVVDTLPAEADQFEWMQVPHKPKQLVDLRTGGQLFGGATILGRIKGDSFIENIEDGVNHGDRVRGPDFLHPKSQFGWNYETHAGGLVVFKDPNGAGRRVYDVDKKEVYEAPGGSEYIELSASGRFSFHEQDRLCYVIDHQSADPKPIPLGPDSEHDFHFSPVAEALTGEYDSEMILVDLRRLRVAWSPNGHASGQEINFALNGAFAVLEQNDGKVRFYQMGEGLTSAEVDNVLFSEDDDNWYVVTMQEGTYLGYRISKSDPAKRETFDHTELFSGKAGLPRAWQQHSAGGVISGLELKDGAFHEGITSNKWWHNVEDQLILKDGWLVAFPHAEGTVLGWRSPNGNQDSQQGISNVFKARLGALKGRETGFLADSEGRVFARSDHGDINKSLGNAFVNASQTFIVEQNGDRIAVFDGKEKQTYDGFDLNGFELVGVNKDWFIFYDKATGERKFFNPRIWQDKKIAAAKAAAAAVVAKADQTLTPAQEKRWQRAQELWKQIATNEQNAWRDGFDRIGKSFEWLMQTARDAGLSDGFEPLLKATFDELYKAQAAELRKRFLDALGPEDAPEDAPVRELDLSNLPF